MFALSIAAVMAILISTLLLIIANVEKEVDRARVRINSYQATIQVAQIIQSAWDLAKKDPTCATFSNVQLLNIAGKRLCMPNTSPGCFSNRFCIERSVSYNIAYADTPLNPMYFENEGPSFAIDISMVPKAYAQASAPLLQPPLAAPPTSNVGVPTCPDPGNRCVQCNSGAGYNADCFKVRVCTNNSETCVDRENYYEALIAIVFQK
jgi:hypothetical protein